MVNKFIIPVKIHLYNHLENYTGTVFHYSNEELTYKEALKAKKSCDREDLTPSAISNMREYHSKWPISWIRGKIAINRFASILWTFYQS